MLHFRVLKRIFSLGLKIFSLRQQDAEVDAKVQQRQRAGKDGHHQVPAAEVGQDVRRDRGRGSGPDLRNHPVVQRHRKFGGSERSQPEQKFWRQTQKSFLEKLKYYF